MRPAGKGAAIDDPEHDASSLRVGNAGLMGSVESSSEAVTKGEPSRGGSALHICMKAGLMGSLESSREALALAGVCAWGSSKVLWPL